MNRARAPFRGFTFLEVVIVLAIAGLLVAIGVPTVNNYIQSSRIAQAKIEIDDMQKSIRKMEVANGALPADLAAAGLNGKADPWGRPYEYFNQRTSTGNGQSRKDKNLKPLNSDFDLYSLGKDGLTASSLLHANSRDDVVRARDGSFIGTAQDFDP
jgi:general secretion pathway protein G